MDRARWQRYSDAVMARPWLRRLLWAWLGWIVLSLLVLNLPLAESLANRKPERFHIQWGFAVSVLPGQVHLWNAQVRGAAGTLAWGAHVRHGSVWLVPWALLSREIRLVGVHANGVGAALRRREVPLPPPAAKEKPWTVRLSRLHARQVWSVSAGDLLLLQGDGRATVDLRKVLSGGEFELALGVVDWRDSRAWLLGEPVLDGGTLGARIVLPPIRKGEGDLATLLAALELDLDADAALPAVALEDGGLRAGGERRERGRLEARIRLRDGRLSDDSRMSLRQPLHLAVGDQVRDRELVVAMVTEGERLRLTADLPAQEGDVDVSEIAARLDLPRPDLAALLASRADASAPSPWRTLARDAVVQADMHLRFRSLGFLRPLLSRWKGLSVEGEGWMRAHLGIDRGQMSPDNHVAFEDARVGLQALGHRLEGRLDGPMHAVDGQPGRHRLDLQKVEVRGPGGELLLEDSHAFIDLVDHGSQDTLLKRIGLALKVEAARIPDLKVFNTYLPNDSIVLDRGSATLSVALALEPDDQHAQGSLHLDSADAGVSVAGMRLAGRLDLDAELRDADLATSTFRLDGTRVALRDVSYTEASGRAVQGWWLEAEVEKAMAQVGTPLRLGGRGRLAMRDLGLVLSLFAQMNDYPRWVFRLVDAGRMDAGARFALDEGEILVDGLHASNRRYSVRARIRLGHGHRRGNLMAKLGPLAIGVDMQDEGQELHLRGVQAWYDAQPAYLPSGIMGPLPPRLPDAQ